MRRRMRLTNWDQATGYLTTFKILVSFAHDIRLRYSAVVSHFGGKRIPVDIIICLYHLYNNPGTPYSTSYVFSNIFDVGSGWKY
jgi:hypothetical protein